MTKSIVAASTFTAFAAFLLPRPAHAASFDCAQAHSPDEIALCADPNLSALDSEMSGLWYAYSRVPMLMGSRGDRSDEAQAFLATRRACGGNVRCLVEAYNSRISRLRQEIDGSMEQFSRMQNSN